MSSERAGVHTSGTLNREKARQALADYRFKIGVAYEDMLLDALEACVVPDPRIARIEALHVPDPYDSGPNPRCADCEQYWPCSTIEVINA